MICATGGGGHLPSIEAFNADPDAAARDAGFMGWWTIGSACGKDIPSTFPERNI